MSCCCKVPAPDFLEPDPPPLCGMTWTARTIRKYGAGVAPPRLLIAPPASDYTSTNDDAWDAFSNSEWFVPSGFTSPAPSSICQIRYWNDYPSFGAIRHIETRYLEDRYLLLTPLVANETQYSLEDLYGVSSAGVAITFKTNGYIGWPNEPGSYTTETYTTAWTQIDAYWGMLSQSQVDNLEATASASGMTDVCSNTLSTGNTLSIASVAADTLSGNEVLTISLDSILTEDGGDYLGILLKVPDSSVAKRTPTNTDLLVGQQECWGPRMVSSRADQSINDYNIIDIFPCLRFCNLNIDVDQNASSIVEDEANVGAFQVRNGTVSTNTLRGQRGYNQSGSGTTSQLTLTGAVNSAWGTPGPLGLDNTNLFPDTPSATFTVDCEPPDDNQTQVWNLSAIGGGHQDGYISAYLYIYNSAAVNTYTFTAELYVDGAWTSPVNFGWQSGNPGWQRVLLASGLSAADFSSAQLRCTSPIMEDEPETFEAIYIHLESIYTLEVRGKCDVFVNEVGGTPYLNFDYERLTNPEDSTYYIDNTSSFQVEIGPGTIYETLGDIDGVEFSFSHDGDDNNDTGIGTEDATLGFTLSNFGVGTGFRV